MTVALYTLKVVKGEFKGKIVQSFDMPQFVYGLSSPILYCFDEENKQYSLFWDHVEEISREEVEVPQEIEDILMEKAEYKEEGESD